MKPLPGSRHCTRAHPILLGHRITDGMLAAQLADASGQAVTVLPKSAMRRAAQLLAAALPPRSQPPGRRQSGSVAANKDEGSGRREIVLRAAARHFAADVALVERVLRDDNGGRAFCW